MPSLATWSKKPLSLQMSSFRKRHIIHNRQVFARQCLVAGWPGLDKGTRFLFHMCGRAIHITHWVCKKSVPFLRADKIGYFRESNSMACPGHAVLGRVIPKTLETTNLQSITRQTLPTTACSRHAVFGRVCSGSLRTTNIHTKTQSQHFYAVGMGT